MGNMSSASHFNDMDPMLAVTLSLERSSGRFTKLRDLPKALELDEELRTSVGQFA